MKNNKVAVYRFSRLPRRRLVHNNLSKSQICFSCFFGRKFSRVSFRDTVIKNVCFFDCDFSGAQFNRATFSNVLFFNCILFRANFINSTFNNVSFSRCTVALADFHGAVFDERTKKTVYKCIEFDDYCCPKFDPDLFPMACPKTGEFIGYKKVSKNRIIKLSIPADANRSSAFSEKCRCSKAIVIEIQDINGNKLEDRAAYGLFNSNFRYEVGKTILPDRFDTNRYKECGHGIHFFMDRKDAVNYLQ